METSDSRRDKLPERNLTMLAVKPVPDSAVAAGLCEFARIPYDPSAFTYFAADVNEDDTRVNHIIGVCTFTMRGGVNRIEYLREAEGIDDEEAMIIMARTVMNFIYRCEADTVSVSTDGVSSHMIKKLGFREKDGEYTINLKKFYISPCKYDG